MVPLGAFGNSFALELVDGGVADLAFQHAVAPRVDDAGHRAIAGDVLAVVPGVPRLHRPLSGTDIRPIWSTGAIPRSAFSSPSGKICSPRTRAKFLPIDLWRHPLVPGGPRPVRRTRPMDDLGALQLVDGQVLRAALHRDVACRVQNAGIAVNCGRCRVLYQALNSSSCLSSTRSVYTRKIARPFFAIRAAPSNATRASVVSGQRTGKFGNVTDRLSTRAPQMSTAAGTDVDQTIAVVARSRLLHPA